MDENTVKPEDLETQDTDTETDDGSVETSEEDAISVEELAELRKKAAERDELAKAKEDLEKKNKQLFARVKKTDEPKAPELSTRDAIALAKADLPDEDIDEVVNYAKYRGVAVKEVLADPTLKAILSTRAEERKTAQATQVSKTAARSRTTDGASLLKQAETSEVPLSDEAMRAIYEARQNALHPKRK